MTDYSGFSSIVVDKSDNGVATLMLNRPDKLNSFTVAMAEEIKSAWQLLREDEEVRAIVVRGAEGRAFCSGVDVTELWPSIDHRPFDYEDPGEWLGPKSNRLWKPVITAVHGMAAGGAFYFLNESDIVICSEDAQFFDPHVTFGLVAAVEPIGALRSVPYQDVMRMALMGADERISAKTALRISLVTEIVTREDLFTRAEAIAARLAAKPPAVIQGTVKAIWESADIPQTVATRNSLKFTQIGNPIGRAALGHGGIAKVQWTER